MHLSKQSVTLALLLIFTTLPGCQEAKKTPAANSEQTKNKPMKPNEPEDTIPIDPAKVHIEYYDFKRTQNGTVPTFYQKDNGWLVEIWTIKDMSMGVCKEYAPASNFYMIYKEYHLNGMIKTRGKFMSRIAFETREYFDEQGRCTKIIDENKKFGTIKREDIIKLLEKEGWMDRKTGKNRITKESVLPTDYNFYHEIMRYMKITFKRAVIDSLGHEVEPPKWYIEISPRNGTYVVRYLVDGHTGAFEKKEEYIMMED